MTRDIGTLAAEIAKPQLNPFFALYVDLPDPVRAWSGIGDLNFNGHTWAGVGAFGSFGTVSENADGTASEMTFILSGVDPTFYRYLVEIPYRGALTEFTIGALDETFTSLAAGPKTFFAGRLTAVDLVNGDELTISITIKRSSKDDQRQRVTRFTDAEQQRLHPGDKFFEYGAQMQVVPILWGREG